MPVSYQASTVWLTIVNADWPDTTLFHGLVPITNDLRISTPYEDHPSHSALTGYLRFAKPLGGSLDLVLLDHNHQPLSFQWKVDPSDSSRQTLPIRLPPYLVPLESATGRVDLLTFDERAVTAHWEFPSLSDFRTAIHDGFDAPLENVALTVPNIDGTMVESIDIWCTSGERFARRRMVTPDGSIRVWLAPGRYGIAARLLATGRTGYTAFEHEAGTSTVNLDWDYFTPGPWSTMLEIVDDRDQPIANCAIDLRIDEGSPAYVPGVVHEVRTTSDNRGVAYLAGLLDGSYSGVVKTPSGERLRLNVQSPVDQRMRVVVPSRVILHIHLRSHHSELAIGSTIRAWTQRAGAPWVEALRLGSSNGSDSTWIDPPIVFVDPSGSTRVLVATENSFGSSLFDPNRLGSMDDSPVVLPVELDDTRSLTGRVTDTSGAALGAAKVTLLATPDGPALWSTTSSDEGFFHLSVAERNRDQVIRVDSPVGSTTAKPPSEGPMSLVIQ